MTVNKKAKIIMMITAVAVFLLLYSGSVSYAAADMDDQDNVKKTEEKLRNLDISTGRCYYLPRDPPVEQVPALYTAGGR